MAGSTTNLFVYGSLQPCGWNHRLIEHCVYSAHPATIRGMLVDLGTIPALIPGDGIVQGMLLEIDSAALAITDRLEGVPLFYDRVQVVAQLADGTEITTWAYQYSNIERAAQCPRLLTTTLHGIPVYEWSRDRL